MKRKTPEIKGNRGGKVEDGECLFLHFGGDALNVREVESSSEGSDKGSQWFLYFSSLTMPSYTY